MSEGKRVFEPHLIPRRPQFGQYRVPWFVTLTKPDGVQPDFRIIDPRRWDQAIREKRCWVCGGRLRIEKMPYAFVVGPMCVVNLVSADPPMHRACAIYSCVVCPFLPEPDRTRRSGVAAIVTTNRYTVVPGAGTKKLVLMGDPAGVLWYREGREATRAEVQESYDSGIHILRKMASEESEEAFIALAMAEDAAEKWFPKEEKRKAE